MAIANHLTHWLKRPVTPLSMALSQDDWSALAVRIEDDGGNFAERWQRLISSPSTATLETLVIGVWNEEMYDESSMTVVQRLCDARAQLTGLRNLFLGEITYDEFEISWIVQSDVSPIFAAYPQLEAFTVRGGSSLAFRELQHDHLKALTVESGGLPASCLRQILAARLPQLTHLELWLGTEDYGGDASLDDVRPLLEKCPFPQLRRLGLVNSERAEELLVALASSPLLGQLEELDLSRGTLGDSEVSVLLSEPTFGRLKKIDLSDNYISPARAKFLRERYPQIVIGEQRDPSEYDGMRYCSVTE